jgi:ribosomal protein S14
MKSHQFFAPKAVFRAIAISHFLPYPLRLLAHRNIVRHSSRRQQDSCYVTDRCRGYVSLYGVSRLVFKSYAMHGVYPGLKKFVW